LGIKLFTNTHLLSPDVLNSGYKHNLNTEDWNPI
jgi:hypothetical protein